MERNDTAKKKKENGFHGDGFLGKTKNNRSYYDLHPPLTAAQCRQKKV
jgi:hypothetical protein